SCCRSRLLRAAAPWPELLCRLRARPRDSLISSSALPPPEPHQPGCEGRRPAYGRSWSSSSEIRFMKRSELRPLLQFPEADRRYAIRRDPVWVLHLAQRLPPGGSPSDIPCQAVDASGARSIRFPLKRGGVGSPCSFRLWRHLLDTSQSRERLSTDRATVPLHAKLASVCAAIIMFQTVLVLGAGFSWSLAGLL